MSNVATSFAKAFLVFLMISVFSCMAFIAGRQNVGNMSGMDHTTEHPEPKKNEKLEQFTKDSVKHALFQAKEVYKNTLKNGTSVSPAYVDSLSRALNISNADLDHVAKINFTLEGKIKAQSVTIDSLAKKTYYFKQKYLAAQFSEADSVLAYTYAGDLGYASFTRKPKGIKRLLGLGKIEKRIDIFSRDPNMNINGLDQMTIKEEIKRKPFGVGINIGYYYNPASGKVERGAGVGINYSLASF